MASRLARFNRDHALSPEFPSVPLQHLTHQGCNCRSAQALEADTNDGWRCGILDCQDRVEIGIEGDNYGIA